MAEHIYPHAYPVPNYKQICPCCGSEREFPAWWGWTIYLGAAVCFQHYAERN